MMTVESGNGPKDPSSEHDDAGPGAASAGDSWRQTLVSCLPGTDTVRNVRHRYRRVEKTLARFAAARIMTTVPRTGGFAYRTLRRRSGELPAGLPDTKLTPTLLANVALDEAIVTGMVGPNRIPGRAEIERVADELRVARLLFRERGWLDDPVSYHRTPPPLDTVQRKSGWAHRLRYDRITFPSEFEPRADEPGRDRWMSYHTNRLASAWVLQHADNEHTARPWLVCIHGFGMGQAFMDFPAFHAAHLHHDLGLNLVGPTLPLHGHRKTGRLGGDDFLGFDLVNGLHGLTQSVWDVRRLLSWVRAQPGGHDVGLYGVSLGAYTASLLSAFDGDLAAVVAGIPATDFPMLYGTQSPPPIRERSIDAGILGGPAEEVYRVVSPLAVQTLVPHERRFIYAGLADRMSHPRQALELWRHWDEPRIRWYPGSHIGYLWSDRVNAFVDEVLIERGLAEREAVTEREG